jgi:hypothetical protein
MGRSIAKSLKAEVNVPGADLVQFVAALGCAILGQRRLARLGSAIGGSVPS